MTDRPHCVSIAKSGAPCRSTLGLSPAGLCLNHDPSRIEQARAVRAAGGHASIEARRAAKLAAGAALNVPAPLKSLADCVRWSSWLATSAARGDIDVRVAREVGLAIREFRASFQLSEITNEVRRLRAELATERARRSPRPS